ncbi:MAG: hypothetical protein NC395_07110 [Prevotella sp.]|nr:hypothetical protein [Prevotella sp.]
MDGYILKPNERLNGGYTVQIGDFTLRLINGYSPSWENVYDTENSFRNFDGSEEKILLGVRFSLKIEVGRIMPEDFKALAAELKKPVIALECPDFEGDCCCDSVPGELKQANFNGVRYGIGFTLIAKNLLTDGDGL